jgi:SAM-dependent methyltransferase
MAESMKPVLPEPFSFYRAILKGDHLHFGLWPDDDSQFSMEDAQENMLNLLLSFFPPPPAKVLDVGCGLGYSAFLLAQKGYEVVAIAPSRELITYAKQAYGYSGAEFRALSYFDEDGFVFSKGQYDVLFFQESTQYLNPLNDAIRKARELLNEKGLVIIGDEVCYDRSIKPETAVHMSTDFVIALAENGFRTVDNQKIGRNVLQTCDFVIDSFSRDFDSIASQSADPKSAENLLFYLNGWKKQKNWYLQGQFGYEIFVSRKDDFLIRPYAKGDEHRILPMFNNIFRVNRTADHWYWKFRDNPYGTHKIAEAYNKDAALVAHYAGYPVPFYSALDTPKTFLSFQIGDTMTSPAVRNVGLGKTGLLARTSSYFYAKFCEGVLPFIYGFNTGKIKKLGMRYLGYTYMDPVPYWTRDLVKNPFDPPSIFTRFFSAYSVKEIRYATDDLDDLFRRACRSYRFLVRKDAAYLRWRYLDCPDKVHRIFSVRKRGRLVGWSVFSKKGDKLIWGDALFDIKYPESLVFLLSALSCKYFSGVESVEGWFSPYPEWWNDWLKELGFQRVQEPNNLAPTFVVFDKSFEELKRHFYYTMGDSDLF